MTSYTPGPWTVDMLDDDLIFDANGKHIATAGNAEQLAMGVETGDEVTANAKLIAAAPFMLQHLQLTDTHLTRCINHSAINRDLQQRLVEIQEYLIRVAIAKAVSND